MKSLNRQCRCGCFFRQVAIAASSAPRRHSHSMRGRGPWAVTFVQSLQSAQSTQRCFGAAARRAYLTTKTKLDAWRRGVAVGSAGEDTEQ